MDDAPTSHQPESAEGHEGADEVMDEAVEEEEEEEEEEEKQRVRLVSIGAPVPLASCNVLTRNRKLPGSTPTAASFEFLQEGHTLGNALRYIIMKKYVSVVGWLNHRAHKHSRYLSSGCLTHH